MAREIGSPAPPEKPLTPEETQAIIMRFALIELVGVVPLMGFFIAYFVLDLIPGRPAWMLVAAILGFAAWAVMSMWLSGFLRLIGQKRSSDAG